MKYWNEYLKQNFKDEQEESYWVQLKLSQYKKMVWKEGSKQDEVEKFIASKTYHYSNKTNAKPMVEINV